jgi:DNA gyrase inhibitor GyrI
MNIYVVQPLHVTIRDLPPTTIVYTSVLLQQMKGSYNDQIRDGFENIKDWARQQGYDPSALKVIGIPNINAAQLIGYECALELEIAPLNTEDIHTKQLPGGRYAILSPEKDSATIGETIRRFFAEYVPQHQLTVDPQRPNLLRSDSMIGNQDG